MSDTVRFFAKFGEEAPVAVYDVKPRTAGAVFRKGREPEWAGDIVEGQSVIYATDPRFPVEEPGDAPRLFAHYVRVAPGDFPSSEGQEPPVILFDDQGNMLETLAL